jgi:predicted transcriptional regulator
VSQYQLLLTILMVTASRGSEVQFGLTTCLDSSKKTALRLPVSKDSLKEKRAMGYTSVLKFLQIMTAKGTVRRNESQRAHVYEACRPAEQTKRQLAGDMVQRVFEGSASQLMMHALAGRRASREEIDELRRLLDEYERSRR